MSLMWCLIAARAGEQPLAGRRENDDLPVADERAVLRLAALDGDGVADLQRVAGPAEARERVRAADLDAPVRDLAGRVGHVDVEVGVRVRPLDLGDHTLQVDR